MSVRTVSMGVSGVLVGVLVFRETGLTAVVCQNSKCLWVSGVLVGVLVFRETGLTAVVCQNSKCLWVSGVLVGGVGV